MHKVEMLDLVTAEDEIIKTLSRDEIYANDMKYVRVVEVFIKNSRGELWIPVRASHKKIAPNGFDIGVGGHVEHGETFREALQKEVREELGWDIKQLPVQEIGKFGPNDGLDTVSMVYEILSDKKPDLNPEDFVSAQWIKPENLARMIREGHPAKSNLLPLLRLVYSVSR